MLVLGVFYTMEIHKRYKSPRELVVKYLPAHRCLEAKKGFNQHHFTSQDPWETEWGKRE